MDLRLPIGGLFTIFGLFLTVFGLVTRHALTDDGRSLYAISLGINVNLAWGIVMLVFGLIFVVFALRAGKPNDIPV